MDSIPIKLFKGDNMAEDIIKKMINIVGIAKSIYKTEPIENLRIVISKEHNSSYIEVEAIQVDSEHFDCYGIESLDSEEEIEQAKQLIRRIRFKNESIEYDGYWGELYINIKNSPKLIKIRKAISDLKYGNFYDELHREDDGYNVITKDKIGLQAFQQKHSDLVNVYQSDFGNTLFNIYIS